MTLLRRERVDVPEMMRRFFDGDWETGWLRVEEFRDDDTYVMRTELPGVDPDKDVEVAVEDDTLHVRAEKEEKTENTAKDGYRTEFRYGYVQGRHARDPSAAQDRARGGSGESHGEAELKGSVTSASSWWQRCSMHPERQPLHRAALLRAPCRCPSRASFSVSGRFAPASSP
jgi:HSP20 family protein